MKPVGDNQVQIHIHKIKNKGMKSFDTFHDPLKPITIGAIRTVLGVMFLSHIIGEEKMI